MGHTVYLLTLLLTFNMSHSTEIMSQEHDWYCSFFNNRAPQAQSGLKNCTWFKENSCCLQQEIEATFDTMKPLKGASVSCQNYINYLMCYICAPNQNSFYRSGYMTVCLEFCDALYDACNTAVLKGSVIGELYQSGEEFCRSRRFNVNTSMCFTFDASHDPRSFASMASHSPVALLSCLIIYVVTCMCWPGTVNDAKSCSMQWMSPQAKKKAVQVECKCKPYHLCQSAQSVKNRTVKNNVLRRLAFHSWSPLFSGVIFFLLMFHKSYGESPDPDMRETVDIWAQKFSEDLTNLATNGLKLTELQMLYDGAHYVKEDINGTDKVDQIRDKLVEFFRKKRTLAEDLAAEVQRTHQEFVVSGEQERWRNEELSGAEDLSMLYYMDTDLLHRLPPSLLMYNRDFKAHVMENNSAVKIPNEVPSRKEDVMETVVWTSYLDSVFIKNRQSDTHLRWQYFGSTSGILRTYPGHEWKRNFVGFHEDYDPRSRPWYQAAISNPKDIVIIVDASSSMKTMGRFNRAKLVARSLLSTLSTQDYVKVVVARSPYWTEDGTHVNSTLQTLGCHGNHLLPVTDSHRKLLISLIDDLEPDGASIHTDAFQEAYDYLKHHQRRDSNCHSFIAFITDGEEYDGSLRCSEGYYKYDEESKRKYIPGELCQFDYSDIHGVCSQPRNQLDSKIHVFPFLVHETQEHLPLKDLSCDQHGSLSTVSNDTDILHQMEPYFEFFKYNPHTSAALWTSPYVDKGGLGLMITVSVPVYSNITDKLLGVVGVDVPLDHIEKEIVYDTWGTAYSFLVDTSDMSAVFHPLSKTATELLVEPMFVPLTDLETHEGEPRDFQHVIAGIESMKDGEYKITENAARAVSVRNSLVWMPTEYSHYFYAGVTGTSFSVVLNMAQADESYHALIGPAEDAQATAYLHTLGLYNSSKDHLSDAWDQLAPVSNQSKYPGREISVRHSTVVLSPSSFCDPAAYLEKDSPGFLDTHHHINSRLTSDNLTCPQAVYHGFRSHVQLTQQIQEAWLGRPSDIQDEVLWTYVGTSNNVMRIYPGVQLDKDFSPTSRPWFTLAEAHPGLVAVSTPYRDSILSDGPPVVSLSHTIHSPNYKSMPPCKMRYTVQNDTVEYEAQPQMSLGCPCSVNYHCLSRLCYRGRCSDNSVLAVVGMDVYYSQLKAHLHKLIQRVGEGLNCDMQYSCVNSKGRNETCEMKCHIVNDKAQFVVYDELSSTHHVSLASVFGYVFNELLQDEVFILHTRTDYQGVCSHTDNAVQDETGTSYSDQGPFPPFQNHYSCIKEVTYYTSNVAKLAEMEGGMKLGELNNDPCASGKYFFSVIPGTNLFLLILTDYVDLSQTAFNFNCHIQKNVFTPTSTEVDRLVCPRKAVYDISYPSRYRSCPHFSYSNVSCAASRAPDTHAPLLHAHGYSFCLIYILTVLMMIEVSA